MIPFSHVAPWVRLIIIKIFLHLYFRPDDFSNVLEARKEIARMPVAFDADDYYMNHTRRGRALIFNHEVFTLRNTNAEVYKTRSGTQEDCNNLEECLKDFGFEVQVHHNKGSEDLIDIVDQAANDNHEDCDCILIAILTHGNGVGVLCSSDNFYKFEEIWSKFTADKCPSLAGKPKIFIIQACQGDTINKAVTLKTNNNSNYCLENDGATVRENRYRIPNQADFMLVSSTLPGSLSWRDTELGTWFIQSLCKEFKLNGTTMELLELLTRVLRDVALLYEVRDRPKDDPMYGAKQIPCIRSMLIRSVTFTPKAAVSVAA